MRAKQLLYWLSVVCLTALLQYLYHPSIPVMIAGAIMMLVLAVLVSWSAPRVGGGMRGGILVTVLSIVSALMFNQGLDVIYRLLAAPEGLRLIMLLEVAAGSLVFLVFALLARVLLARPKVEK